MRIVISIDDTDNLEGRGTGEIASLVADELQQKGWGSCGFTCLRVAVRHGESTLGLHLNAAFFPLEAVAIDVQPGAVSPVVAA